MSAPRAVIAEARHGYASSPFYRAHWGAVRPADPPPLDPAAVAAYALAHDDPYGGLLAQGLVVGGLFAAYPISVGGQRLLVAAGDADLAWDRAAARNTLCSLGATPQDTVLVIEGNARAYQHRVWVAAVQDLKARNVSVEPADDSPWSVSFVAAQLRPAVVLGLSNATWNGLAATEASRWATFRHARVLVADHDFAADPPTGVRLLRRLRVAGMEWVESEPGGGVVAPTDRVYLEVFSAGAVADHGAGELLVTTVQRDACPLVRLRTGLGVELRRDHEAQRVWLRA